MILSVKAENQNYDIVVENGSIKNLCGVMDLNRKVLIVSDDGVPEQYAVTVASQCKNPVRFVFPHGEESKNIDTFKDILSAMLESGFTRKDCVVALGGGVTGDISGFAASCYMRGIDFYNIPTTLLSQIDSSIGGKTAIDFNGIKNSVGAFYMPKAVVIDPDVLATLDRRQLYAGLAEAIKMAATCDEELFEFIENSENITEDLPEIIIRSIKIKKYVVELDPKESCLRKVLNFGHTVGHAIESYYDGKFLHGECVSGGMLFFCSDEVSRRIEKVLIKYELPTYFDVEPDMLISAVMHDKKCENDTVSCVYVNKIGKFEFLSLTGDEILERMLSVYEK